jgi:hypothetical protein
MAWCTLQDNEIDKVPFVEIEELFFVDVNVLPSANLSLVDDDLHSHSMSTNAPPYHIQIEQLGKFLYISKTTQWTLPYND